MQPPAQKYRAVPQCLPAWRLQLERSVSQSGKIKLFYRGMIFLHNTWNNGMAYSAEVASATKAGMEYWNVGFQRNFFIYKHREHTCQYGF